MCCAGHLSAGLCLLSSCLEGAFGFWKESCYSFLAIVKIYFGFMCMNILSACVWV